MLRLMNKQLIALLLVSAAATLSLCPPLAAQTEKPRSTELMPGQTFRECRNCPEMIVLPAGTFVMGSPADEPRSVREPGAPPVTAADLDPWWRRWPPWSEAAQASSRIGCRLSSTR